MNKKVVIGLVIVLIAIIIAVLGYFVMLKVEQNNVQNTIVEIFEKLKSNENNTEKQNIFSDMKAETTNENIEKDSSNYLGLFDKLEYTIVENNTSFNEATVNLEITNKDMKQIIKNYFTRAIQLAFANAFTNTYSEEEIDGQLTEYLKEQVQSDEIDNITTNVAIKLEKNDGKWVIKEESKMDFASAVLPGFAEIIKSLKEATEQAE